MHIFSTAIGGRVTGRQGRVRILRIIARMNVGGPAVQVSGLMRHLDFVRFEQRLLTGYCADDEADFLDTQAPDVIATRIEGLGRSISLRDDLRALIAIRREIKAFSPHVVHTHTAKAGVLGRIAALTVRPRPRLVHTFHGHLLHGYFGRLGTRLVISVEQVLAMFTDELVAVGPEVRDDLLRAHIGSVKRFRVVEPGLELRSHPTNAQARHTIGLPLDVPVIAVLGRLTGIKRPDRMLEVVAQVLKQIPALQVVVAGDGDLREACESAARERQLPVHFLGWREDIENVLAASDVTLLTSDNEGTPLSIIQAAMLGVPCVSTDVGSVRHVVRDGETGWVTAVGVSELSTALIEALGNSEERERRGRNAEQWARHQFSVERLAREYGQLYDELAGHQK